MATKDQDEPFVTNSTTPPSDSMSTSATPADMTPVTRSSDGGGQRSQKTTEVREASFVERTSAAREAPEQYRCLRRSNRENP